MTGIQSIMKKLKAVIGSPISQVIQPGRANFAMIEKVALHNLDQLMQEDMQAARLVMSLIRLMEPGSGGIVVASNKSLQELLGVSESTVARALRTLVKGNWVQRIRVAGAHALAINTTVAWVGPRGQMEHAVFQATVVASRSEQDEYALNPGELKKIPVAHPTEAVLPVGETEPPAQELIPGTEQVARMGHPETGEMLDPWAHLQGLSQERISTAARAQLGGFFTPTSHVLPDDGQEFDIPHQFKDKP
jgi:hypothetical protein